MISMKHTAWLAAALLAAGLVAGCGNGTMTVHGEGPAAGLWGNG